MQQAGAAGDLSPRMKLEGLPWYLCCLPKCQSDIYLVTFYLHWGRRDAAKAGIFILGLKASYVEGLAQLPGSAGSRFAQAHHQPRENPKGIRPLAVWATQQVDHAECGRAQQA